MDILRDIEFDDVFEVHEDGSVTTDVKGVYAPECYNDDITDIDLCGGETIWDTVSDGFTGQYRYHGPVMHPSEYLSDKSSLGRHILENPGVYTVVIVECPAGLEDAECPNCKSKYPSLTPPYGHRMWKCDSCHLAFDNETAFENAEPEPAGWAVLKYKGETK